MCLIPRRNVMFFREMKLKARAWDTFQDITLDSETEIREVKFFEHQHTLHLVIIHHYSPQLSKIR